MRNTRYILLLLASGIISFQGCLMNDDDELKEKEQRLLKQYLRENNITVEPTASGLYFIPIEEGAGPDPLFNQLVQFEYTGELVDGTIFGTTYDSIAEEADFDTENMVFGPIQLIVGNTLPGLAEGFQLMKADGKAKMILPSDLGYGGNSVGVIPRYATLIFTIHLKLIIPNPYEYEENMIRDFLAANEYEVDPTESGLYYIEHEAGEGDLIGLGDYVSVYYKGYFLDGRVFDSNYGEETYGFSVTSDYIPEGWNEGVKLMKKGTKATLIVPFDLAYGEQGWGSISPFMTLVFDMEIDDVN